MGPLKTGLLTLVALAAAACSTGHAAPVSRPIPVPTTSVRSTTVPPTTVQPTTVRPTTTTVDPGLLPQTDALPQAGTAQFRAEMAALWRGVVDDSVRPAMPAFFPESAYRQVKTVADPSADWQYRLVQDFSEDLAAAHQLLGPDASSATLQAVNVPSEYAHWVPAGVCANRVGYYEVANSRVVYEQHGAVHSFGIASLISWRGVWYVVHLGAILRSGSGGQVDDPQSGPGTSAPSHTC